jgi:hypothetical protein
MPARTREEIEKELAVLNRISELKKELETHGYVVERREVKESREDLAKGVASCAFWVALLVGLILLGSGVGHHYAGIGGALGGGGFGGVLTVILAVLVQKAYDKKRYLNEIR